MLNPFSGDHFRVHELTLAINRAPYRPGRIGELGIFQSSSVFRTHVDIEYKDNTLSLIKTRERGSNSGDVIVEPKRSVYPFKIPHLAQFSTILPDDLPDLRAFGTEDGKVAFNTVVAERLAQMRDNLDATIEWHMMGAIHGKIVDPDAEVIHDLWTIFGINETEIGCDFSSDPEESFVITCNEIHRAVQDSLGATPYSRLHVLCGDRFYDYLSTSLNVAGNPGFLAFQDFNRSSHVRSSFNYQGITWENYRGSVGGVDFLASDEARVVPVGVPGLFIRRNGPADTIENVGRRGLPYVVTREFRPHNTGVELKAQANPLILATRPKALVKLVLEDY